MEYYLDIYKDKKHIKIYNIQFYNQILENYHLQDSYILFILQLKKVNRHYGKQLKNQQHKIYNKNIYLKIHMIHIIIMTKYKIMKSIYKIKERGMY